MGMCDGFTPTEAKIYYVLDQNDCSHSLVSWVFIFSGNRGSRVRDILGDDHLISQFFIPFVNVPYLICRSIQTTVFKWLKIPIYHWLSGRISGGLID